MGFMSMIVKSIEVAEKKIDIVNAELTVKLSKIDKDKVVAAQKKIDAIAEIRRRNQ